MTTASATTGHSETEPQESWVPMITIALGQMIMSFNVASLPVALGGMVNSFGVPPTTITIIPAGQLPNFIPGEVPDPARRRRGKNE